MNAEEIDGDGGGANGSVDRVDDGGVERAGVEEDEELGRNERGNRQLVRSEEDEHAEGQSQRRRPERNKIESAMVLALPAMRDPAAGNGARDAVNNGNGSDDEAGVGDGEAVVAMQKSRHPGGDATERKGDLSEAEGRGEESGILEYRKKPFKEITERVVVFTS